VLAQETRELVGRHVPVERPDRITDVVLVSEQPVDGRGDVWQVVDRAHDHHARPDDVVLPEHPHGVMERGAIGSGGCGDGVVVW
jgi:hypothetical protein